FFFFQAEDGIRDFHVTGVQTCALPICIDLNLLAQAAGLVGKDVGRNAEALRRKILELQASFNAVDRCRKPVLAAIQGYCLGGAIDLIAACDMRYASRDAQFSIKEIDMGM